MVVYINHISKVFTLCRISKENVQLFQIRHFWLIFFFSLKIFLRLLAEILIFFCDWIQRKILFENCTHPAYKVMLNKLHFVKFMELTLYQIDTLGMFQSFFIYLYNFYIESQKIYRKSKPFIGIFQRLTNINKLKICKISEKNKE